MLILKQKIESLGMKTVSYVSFIITKTIVQESKGLVGALKTIGIVVLN